MSQRQEWLVERPLPNVQVFNLSVWDLGANPGSVDLPVDLPRMDVDSKELLLPQRIEAGTRIIVRCDALRRPYFPTASFYEPGTVTGTYGERANGRYLSEFRHDPWPPEVYAKRDDYMKVYFEGLTEITAIRHGALGALNPGTWVVVTQRPGGAEFFFWGQVMTCSQDKDARGHNLYKVKVVPGQYKKFQKF